jgi:hypothetical protein
MLYEDMRPRLCFYPLISFAVYFTHPAHPSCRWQPSEQPLGLFTLIRQEMTNFHFRLDIYFLPPASEEDCMAHYRAQINRFQLPSRIHPPSLHDDPASAQKGFGRSDSFG